MFKEFRIKSSSCQNELIPVLREGHKNKPKMQQEQICFIKTSQSNKRNYFWWNEKNYFSQHWKLHEKHFKAVNTPSVKRQRQGERQTGSIVYMMMMLENRSPTHSQASPKRHNVFQWWSWRCRSCCRSVLVYPRTINMVKKQKRA